MNEGRSSKKHWSPEAELNSRPLPYQGEKKENHKLLNLLKN